MGRRHRHQHDLVAGPQRPDTMDHASAADVEAPARLGDHRVDRLFGHARVVLELHRRDVRAVVAVAHGADEGGDGTHFAIAVAQRCHFGGEVEVGLLDRHARALHACDSVTRPAAATERAATSTAVTGGKNATSAPSRRTALSSTMALVERAAHCTSARQAACVLAAAREQDVAQCPERGVRRHVDRFAGTQRLAQRREVAHLHPHRRRRTHVNNSGNGRNRTVSPRAIACAGGLSIRPSAHTIEVNTPEPWFGKSSSVPSAAHTRAQELAPRVGFAPIEVCASSPRASAPSAVHPTTPAAPASRPARR